MEARKLYQQRVQQLLDAIAERRHRLLVLTAGGATPAGRSEIDAELSGLRDELAAVIAAGSLPAGEPQQWRRYPRLRKLPEMSGSPFEAMISKLEKIFLPRQLATP